jgi:hypothetical protein
VHYFVFKEYDTFLTGKSNREGRKEERKKGRKEGRKKEREGRMEEWKKEKQIHDCNSVDLYFSKSALEKSTYFCPRKLSGYLISFEGL